MRRWQFEDFDDIIFHDSTPILVDFFASHTDSRPCRMMSRELAKVGAVMGKRVKIVKIDTDKYPGVARRFNIVDFPTSILFEDGSLVGRFEGLIPAQQLKVLISARICKQSAVLP